jgi:hypothetical protein
MLLLKLCAIAGLIFIGLAVVRLAEQHGISQTGAFWLSVLNPLMLLHFVAGGHNDSLMIAGMLWAFVFAQRHQPALAIVSLALAAGIKPIALLALPFLGFAIAKRTTTWTRVIGSWLVVSVGTLGLLAAIGFALNVGVGWIGALTTPGSVRTLLSPATALGEVIGWISNAFNQDLGDSAITIARVVCLALAFGLLVVIILRPERQSPVRQAGFAFSAVIVLSPVVQPWYLLWALPLVATSGLARAWHLRTVVLGTAFFVIYALSDINVVTDSSIDYTDLISIAAAAFVVLVVLMSSKRERQLAIGEQFASGLRPSTDEEKAIAASQRMHITK